MNLALFTGLLDDAAVFPPGLMPLPDAVAAHERHAAAPYGALVGPLVIAAPALSELGALLAPRVRTDLAVTAPGGPEQARSALAAAAALPARLRALEVGVPAGMPPAELFAALDGVRAGAGDAAIFVEVPRDERRAETIATCAAAGYRAKFRTGGVTADLYPDEAELAAAVRAVVDAGVPFKATAGLHHAIRNTDPRTGFEQHGFLNLLLAVDAALDGADEERLAAVLADRDAAAVAARVAGLTAGRAAAVRSWFLSFGTCDITDPLTDLVRLDLVPASLVRGKGAL